MADWLDPEKVAEHDAEFHDKHGDRGKGVPPADQRKNDPGKDVNEEKSE